MAPLPKRSALAGLPGVPWWGAVAVAVGCTMIGASVDMLTSSDTVTGSFNWLYAIGCVLAALVVANNGLFTAAVQPSLILFVAVPCTTWLLSPGQQTSNKALLLLVVPLISRFPWMAWVSGIALAICLVRWGLWRLAQRRATVAAARAKTSGAKKAVERRPSSVAPPRRHRTSREEPGRSGAAASARKVGLAERPERKDSAAGARRRVEPLAERRIDPPLARRPSARTNGGPSRPRIDPRGIEPLRHTPSFGLPPLSNGTRYRQDPATWSGSPSSARSAKHALPPARVPAPPEPRQTPRRRRYEDD